MNIPASCPNLTFGSIPKGHLFHEKQKPVIIAHRGQPKKFQENTLDGVLSVQEIHADGFEVDIYVTKDKKLVLFHDDNTEVSFIYNSLISVFSRKRQHPCSWIRCYFSDDRLLRLESEQ